MDSQASSSISERIERTRFDALLPRTACVVEAAPEDWNAGLTREELIYVAHAAPKRVREFTAGRNCARRALQAAGHPACSIPVKAGRAPQFPAGYAGSITHTEAYCAAAILPTEDLASVGIDAEPNDSLSSDLIELIASAAERSMIDVLCRRRPDIHWSKLVFSAKEAFFKAYYPLRGQYLDFHDVMVHLDPSTNCFRVNLLQSTNGLCSLLSSGRYRLYSDLICTGFCIREADLRGA